MGVFLCKPLCYTVLVNISIRPAKREDFPHIQRLSQELTISDSVYDPILVKEWAFTKEGITYLQKRIEAKRCICLVAEVSGVPVGYATGTIMKKISWRPGKRIELENLIVNEKFRNAGIGSQLLEEFFSWGRKAKAAYAEVHSYYNNQAAIAIYKRHTFTPLTVVLETKLV